MAADTNRGAKPTKRLSPLRRELVAALRMLREERVARGATHMVIDQRIEELTRGIR